MDKNKNATINPVNDDNKCFQYAAKVALNHEELGKNSQRISKIKCFVYKCNCKGVNYLSGKVYRKKVEKNNPSIVLNVLYVKKMNIYILPTFQNITQTMKNKSFR